MTLFVFYMYIFGQASEWMWLKIKCIVMELLLTDLTSWGSSNFMQLKLGLIVDYYSTIIEKDIKKNLKYS